MTNREVDYHVSNLERHPIYRQGRNTRMEPISERNIIMHISDVDKDKTSENITALISDVSRDAPIPELPTSDSTLAAFHAVSQYAFFSYRTGLHNIAQAYNITRGNANRVSQKLGPRQPFQVSQDVSISILQALKIYNLLLNPPPPQPNTPWLTRFFNIFRGNNIQAQGNLDNIFEMPFGRIEREVPDLNAKKFVEVEDNMNGNINVNENWNVFLEGLNIPNDGSIRLTLKKNVDNVQQQNEILINEFFIRWFFKALFEYGKLPPVDLTNAFYNDIPNKKRGFINKAAEAVVLQNVQNTEELRDDIRAQINRLNVDIRNAQRAVRALQNIADGNNQDANNNLGTAQQTVRDLNEEKRRLEANLQNLNGNVVQQVQVVQNEELIREHEYYYGYHMSHFFHWIFETSSELNDVQLVFGFLSYFYALAQRNAENFSFNIDECESRVQSLNTVLTNWNTNIANAQNVENANAQNIQNLTNVIRTTAGFIRALKTGFKESVRNQNKRILAEGADLICANLSTSMYFLSSFLTQLIIPTSLDMIGIPGSPEPFYSAATFTKNEQYFKTAILEYDFTPREQRQRTLFTDAGISVSWRMYTDKIKRALATMGIILDEVIEHFKMVKNEFARFDAIFKKGDDPTSFLNQLYYLSLRAIPRLQGITHSNIPLLIYNSTYYYSGDGLAVNMQNNDNDSIKIKSLAKNNVVVYRLEHRHSIKSFGQYIPLNVLPFPNTKFSTLFDILPEVDTESGKEAKKTIFVSWHYYKNTDGGHRKVWAAIPLHQDNNNNEGLNIQNDQIIESRPYNIDLISYPSHVFKGDVYNEPIPFAKIVFLKPEFSIGFRGFKDKKEFFAPNVAAYENYFALFKEEVNELFLREGRNNTERLTATEATFIARDNTIIRGLTADVL